MLFIDDVKLLLFKLVRVVYIRYGYSGSFGWVNNIVVLMVGISNMIVEKVV